jgi:hypothetical protein
MTAEQSADAIGSITGKWDGYPANIFVVEWVEVGRVTKLRKV